MAKLVVEYAGEEPILAGERVSIQDFAEYWDMTPWHGEINDWKIVDDSAPYEATV